jgi:hypothetical protein
MFNIFGGFMKKALLNTTFVLLLLGLFVGKLHATVPTVQAKYIAISSVSDTTATINFTRGNGTARIVVIRTDNNWAATDAILTDSGPTYTDVNGNFLTAPWVGTTGSKVIDVVTGTSRTSNLSNLAASTTYYIKIYEYNVVGANWDYNNTSVSGNPRSFKTVSTSSAGAPTGLTYTSWSEGGYLTWTDAATATGYFLSVYDNGSSSWVFQDWDIGKPSDQRFNIFNLSASQQYTYYLWGYDNNYLKSTSSASVTGTTLATPSFTSVSFTPGHGNTQGIGQTIVATVTAYHNQIGLVPNGAQQINSVTVTSTFTDNRDGTYTLTYTVADGDNDVNDASQDLPCSFTFQDGNSVSSSTYNGSGNNSVAPGVDAHRPYVVSINRQLPSSICVNNSSVTFRVTFNENIQTSTLSASDFTLTVVSGSVSGYTISAPTVVTSNTVFDVTVNGITGNGVIRLDFTGQVADVVGNTSNTTFTTGQTYTIDQTNPSGTITSPAHLSCSNSAPGTISGTATDGTGCGVSTVEVAIWRDADFDGNPDGVGSYWDGSAWSGTSPTWLLASGTTSWSWTVTATINTTARYYVQVRVTDAAGNVYTSSATAYYFIYDNTPPSGGSVTAPVSGECVKAGSYTITWTSATDPNLSTNVAIDYWDGSTWQSITSSTPNDGSESWTVPGGTFTSQIRITFTDCAGNSYQLLSSNFYVDNTPPTAGAITAPSAGSCVIRGNNLNITWNSGATNDGSNPLPSNPITLEYNYGSGWNTIATNLPNSGSYTWSIPAGQTPSNNYQIRMTVTDCAGNTDTSTSGTFTIDDFAVSNNPSDYTTCNTTGSHNFSATITSSVTSPTYQWQYSTSSSGPWNSVGTDLPIAGFSYSGANSQSLTVNWSGITAPDTVYYRLAATSCGTTLYSNAAKLQIAQQVTPGTFGPDDYASIGSSYTLTLPYTGGAGTISWELRKYSGSGCSGSDSTVATGSVTPPSAIQYTFSNIGCGDDGYYKFVVSDACASNVASSCTHLHALAPEPSQATNISGGRTRTTINLIWTSGNGMMRLVAATQGSTTYTGIVPDDGTDYSSITANAYWPSAGAFGTNTKLVYRGTGNNVFITGLSPSTWYTFRIFEYNWDNNCSTTSLNYNTTTNSSNPKAIKTTARDFEEGSSLLAGEFEMTLVKPNPVESDLEFSLSTAIEARYTIQIVSVDGRVLFTTDQVYPIGVHLVNISLDPKVFSSGVYYLRVLGVNESIQQMFVYLP